MYQHEVVILIGVVGMVTNIIMFGFSWTEIPLVLFAIGVGMAISNMMWTKMRAPRS